MRPVRCRLRRHRWRRAAWLATPRGPFAETLTNAVCMDCGRRGWQHWAPLSEREELMAQRRYVGHVPESA